MIFLAAVHELAAARAIQAITVAVDRLPEHPRQGRRLPDFDPREVRRIIVRSYEVRCEIHDETIVILRLWHTRENR